MFCRSLLQTLHGPRVMSRDVTIDDVTPRSLATSRMRLDSLTSATSSIAMAGRPRSHHFTVEPVDDSVLLDAGGQGHQGHSNNHSVSQDASPVSGTGVTSGQDGGVTNASFVIDLNNAGASPASELQTLLGDGNSSNNTATTTTTGAAASAVAAHDSPDAPSHNLHVEFNTVPEIISIPASASEPAPGSVIGGDAPINQLSVDMERLEPLPPLPEVSSEHNSSTESLQIQVDSEQCTVTSLTPLLPRDSDSEDPDVMTSSSCAVTSSAHAQSDSIA